MIGRTLWMTLWVVACSEAEYDPTVEERIADILELEGNASAGDPVFGKRCAGCHGSDGSGTDEAGEYLAGADIRGLAAADVVTAVADPPTGMFTFETLANESIADVAAYVEGLDRAVPSLE